jgi:hypothetical protein
MPSIRKSKPTCTSRPNQGQLGKATALLLRSCLISLLSFTAAVACPAQVNVLTYHNDNARTGQNLNETILTPATVNPTNFGKVGFMSMDGLVDGQPLYVTNLTVAGTRRNVVFVVTENDSVYAFDADSFAQLWHVSALPSGDTPSDDRGCSQVLPQIGITSTPVIDLNNGPHGTIFVVAMSKDATGGYHQRLHALEITTGAEIGGSPSTITASYTDPRTGKQSTFAPGQYKERTALLLLNGVIYLSWASHCDDTPFQGWVMGYSESTLQQVSVLNLTPNGTAGAIWMSGSGLAADGTGNIYFLDANGTFDDTLNASQFPENDDYGNSFLKLSTSGNTLSVADYFTMHDTDAETSIDEDLGSGGAMVLPDLQDGSGNTWHLAVGSGKDSNIYVVNRDLMGKFNTSNDSAIYQEIQGALANGVWAAPAYFNNHVYYCAVSDHIKAFKIFNAKLLTAGVTASAEAFAYPGTTPSISANGNSNGIVWAVENMNGAGVLHAFDAANLATELYNSNQSASGRDHFVDNKFITPLIANGKVFIGTPTGVAVFGVLSGGVQPPASPTFSPFGGSINSAQPITISDSTSGATIYYTTNGTAPTAIAAEQYSGPFTLSASTTVKAIAATNGVSSQVASASFTVLPAAAVPSISPAGGTITSLQSITITDTTSGTMIYYTTDGSAPTPGGTTTKQYGGPFTLSGSATVKAIATGSGFSNSGIASAAFTVQSSPPSPPTISVDFVGKGTPMASAEIAGVIPKSHWNNASGASNSSPLSLLDENGVANGATITWTSDDTWAESITDQPGNIRMMKGYLDNGQQHATTVNVGNLPFSAGGYAVYVYADGAGSLGTTNTGVYQLSGAGIATTSVSLTYTSNFNGVFIQANNSIGNYIVFTIHSTAFTLSAIPGVASNGFKRAPVNGIQIVPLVDTAATSASAISIDFVGLGTTPMGSSEVAGVVALSNWNDVAGAKSSSPLALVDQNGNPLTATVTWTADDVWDQPIADQSGNMRMMKGYLDNGHLGTTTVTVSGLPANASGYTVYVYAGGTANNSSNTAIYQISGAGITTTSATLTYNSNFNGTFTQATASNPTANYVVLTIPNVSGFTLSAIPSTASSSNKRAPVNGLQIVPR